MSQWPRSRYAGRAWAFALGLGMALLLTACEDAPQDPQYAADQRYFFLESLKQIDQGGTRLRAARDEQAVRAALDAIDQGLKLAYQVEAAYLDSLDSQLGRFYQRFLVEGVESYRIGIEAGDAGQQEAGLQLLSDWARYWAGAREAVEARLAAS